MTLSRRIACLLAAGALVGTTGSAAVPAPALAQDTAAVAVNTKDGSSVFRLAFSVRRIMGDVVDQQNAAVAYASCEACQTVAISIQILLVASDPDVVTPTNLAIAINDACDLCETLASAYQFVVGGQRLQLSGQGRQELQRINRALRDLGRSTLSIEEIQARTDVLMDELRRVLSTELVALPGGGGDADEQPDDAAPTPQDQDGQPDADSDGSQPDPSSGPGEGGEGGGDRQTTPEPPPATTAEPAPTSTTSSG